MKQVQTLTPIAPPAGSSSWRFKRFVVGMALAAMGLAAAGSALAQNNTLRVNKGFSPSPVAAGSP